LFFLPYFLSFRSPPQQHANKVNRVAIRREMVAARTSQVALPKEAGEPATLELMVFRTIPKIAKLSTMQTRETRKARKTINEANKNPN
jgi:hypothetical protein